MVVSICGMGVVGEKGVRGKEPTSAGALLGGVEQDGAVVGNGHAEDQHASDVEEDDAQEGLVDGARDVLAGVRGLAKGHADQLGAEVGEGSLHHACPDAEEAAGVAADDGRLAAHCRRERGKGAWVLPKVETGPDVAGAAAERDDEAEQDQHQDNERLD